VWAKFAPAARGHDPGPDPDPDRLHPRRIAPNAT
jgi:hypothetical protein